MKLHLKYTDKSFKKTLEYALHLQNISCKYTKNHIIFARSNFETIKKTYEKLIIKFRHIEHTRKGTERNLVPKIVAFSDTYTSDTGGNIPISITVTASNYTGTITGLGCTYCAQQDNTYYDSRSIPETQDNKSTYTFSNISQYNSGSTGVVYYQGYATINDVPYYTPVYTAIVASGGCLGAGTLITLKDGSLKKIEDISYSDQLLVWDFDEGKYNSSKPVLIMHNGKCQKYTKLEFNDGSILKIVL